MLRKILLGSAIGLFAVGVAIGQQWLPYPRAGGSSFCSSTVNNTCVNTVPAGPALTGAETIPADTNAANGVSPKTVVIPIGALSGGVQNAAPLTNTQVDVKKGVGKVLLNPAGTIASLALVLPAKADLYDGQTIIIGSSQTVTSLSLVAGTNTTLATASTTVTAAAPLMYVYSDAASKWYKIK